MRVDVNRPNDFMLYIFDYFNNVLVVKVFFWGFFDFFKP